MLLIVFLKYSQELHDFCCFDIVADASKFSHFKQDFLMDLQSMFDHIVDIPKSCFAGFYPCFQSGMRSM